MNIYKDLSSISQIPNPIITIGTFDGVHLGHQRIIQQLNEEAKKVGGQSVLFTFYPHPRMVLFPESHGLKLIQTQEEKIAKLNRVGLQNMIIYPFTFEFSRLTALEFVRNILVNQLNIHKIVIGYDHQFGKNREGNISFLKELAETYNFEVVEIPAEEVDAVNVSSTKVREALLEGNIERANEFLGEPFELTGKVVQGDSLGRTLGYPTANIEVDSDIKLVPGNGVYAVNIWFEDRTLKGMMNIGVRPTVSKGLQRTIEVHIFDFNEDLYGQTITVQFLARNRDEMRFSSIEELKNQLKEDEKSIRNLLVDL